MGRVRSKTFVENVVINGRILGDPTIVRSDGSQFSVGDSIEDLWFAWDDPAIPNGILGPGDTVIPEPSLIEITDAQKA